MVLDSFKRFYSDSFNSSILVSNFLTSRAKSIEDILLELESHLCKIRLRIASCVTTCYDDLTSRILNLSRLHLALQDLEFRIMFFKKEVKNSNFSCTRKAFRLKYYYWYMKKNQATTKSLRFIVRCLNGLETLRTTAKLFECCDEKKCQRRSDFSLKCSFGIKIKNISCRDSARAAKLLYSTEMQMKKAKIMNIYILDSGQEFLKSVGNMIRARCSNALHTSVQNLNQNDLGYALQASYNLKAITLEVYNMLKFLASSVATSLDEALSVSPKPSPEQAPKVRSKLWKNLEKVWDKVHVASIQAWNLERVLKKKRDPSNRQNILMYIQTSTSYVRLVNQEFLLEEELYSKGFAINEMLYKPFNVFWKIMTALLKKRFTRIAKEGVLAKRIFSQEYPRLRFALNDIFFRISRSTTTQAFESDHGDNIETMYRKSTLISITADFLKIFLARSHSRLLSVVPDNMPDKKSAEVFVATAAREEDMVKHDKELLLVTRKRVENVSLIFCKKAIYHAVLECGRGVDTKSNVLILSSVISNLTDIKNIFCLRKLCKECKSLLEETIRLLASTGSDLNKQMYSLPNSVLLHFIVSQCPSALEYPHILENISASEYVTEWIKTGELQARKKVMKSLDLYRQRVSVNGSNSMVISKDRYIHHLELLLGR